MDSAEGKYLLMTESPVKKLVCRLAVPTMISMIITSVYNIADTFFVGKIGTSATAAVGVALPLMTLIQALGFMFGHGSGNYISRLLGTHKHGDASRIASVGFFAALIAGLIVCAAGLAALRPLTVFMGATETMLPHAIDYIGLILIGAPIMMGSCVLNNQMRFQGSAVYAMVGIAAGAVINIGLDPLFIFVFKMGTAGAALATVISQTASFVILLLMMRRGDTIRISLRNFRPDFRNFMKILAGGLPSLWRQGLAAVAMICLNVTAKVYGDPAVAAMTVVAKIMTFAGSLLIGFGQGFQPVCGFNYGAGKYRRVREAFFFCAEVSFAVMVAMSVAGYFCAAPLVRMFRDDAEVVAIGAYAMRLQCYTFPLVSWYMISNMMLQTIGKSVRASLLAASRQGIFFIPLIWLLARYQGLLGIELAQPLADVLSLLLSVPLCLSVLGEMRRKERGTGKIANEAITVAEDTSTVTEGRDQTVSSEEEEIR